MGILTGLAAGAQVIGGMMQRRSEKKAATTQYERTKELQDRAHGQQKELWDYTNYPNQRKMMEEAGLNPALMYGQGGGGGATAGSGNMGSVSQEQVSNVGANAAQAAMMASQIELTKAQTEKTKVEAEKIGGVDTEVAGLDAKLKEIATNIQGTTQQAQINQINDMADRALSEAVQAMHDQIISEETFRDKITKIKADSVGAIIQNDLLRSNKEVNEARIEEITQNILQRWEHIAVDREGQQTSRDNMESLTKAMLWGAGINATGNIVNNIVDIVAKPAGTLTKTTTKRSGGETTKTTTDRRNY